MKQGTLITRVVMLLLFAVVCAYLGVSAWKNLDEGAYFVTTYAYTVDDAAEATGLLVRQEEVIPGQTLGIVDVLPAQGEKVAAGETVANLYRDESALERKRQIRTLELELEQIKYSLSQGGSGWDNARIDQSIVDAMMGLKTSAAYGDLTGLEDQVLTFKSLVIRRSYAASDDTSAIAQTAGALESNIAALQFAAGQDTTPVRVSKPGTFSAVPDGYESLLTPDILSTLTVSQLDKLMEQKPDAPTGTVGKLITSSKWYFTAALPTDVAGRLVEGRTVRVRFSRDWAGDVTMKVERVSDEENGRRAVVLSSTRYLADTSLLRKQTVDIIFHSTTGIRVPKKAVRDELITTKDPETGEEITSRVTGVYVLTGAQSEFKKVEILEDDGDYYLVQAVLPAVPTDNQIKTALRAGDEVIITAEPLFEGKVILET